MRPRVFLKKAIEIKLQAKHVMGQKQKKALL